MPRITFDLEDRRSKPRPVGNIVKDLFLQILPRNYSLRSTTLELTRLTYLKPLLGDMNLMVLERSNSTQSVFYILNGLLGSLLGIQIIV
jgi:hypothetical protein